MSYDIAPRHRYIVYFQVAVVVDAETEDKAIDYAEKKLADISDIPELDVYLYNVERVDA